MARVEKTCTADAQCRARQVIAIRYLKFDEIAADGMVEASSN